MTSLAKLHSGVSSQTRLEAASESKKCSFPTRRSSVMKHIQRLILACAISWLPQMAWGLRHTFKASKDKRAIIGPVGVPFGFLPQGRFELTVSDFELALSKKVKAKIDNEADYFSGMNPGFLLHRFKNDAAYTKYLSTLQLYQGNTSSCSFNYFLDRDTGGQQDILNDDTMTFEEVGEIESAENGVLLMMRPRKTKWKPNTPKIEYNIKDGEAGLYFLTYQVCASDEAKDKLKHVRSSFELDFHFMNIDASGYPTYLPAGELHLPFLFFFFAVAYLICSVIWIMNIRNIGRGGAGLFDPPSPHATRPIVYPIHKLMAALLCFKFLSVFIETLRYHRIRITGHAELWSFVYYSITFVKGIFLFTVILLIGTGWSFVKPFLNANEKRIIFGILFLQVINNLAIAVLSHETAGEKSFEKWNAVLHLVDIVCCCAVLLPIVWQVNSLEKSLPNSESPSSDGQQNAIDVGLDEHDIPDDGPDDEMGSSLIGTGNRSAQDQEKGHILSKLKLFRSFYLLVVTYIYLTRIIVYLFATLLDYQHLWMRYGIVEAVTLAFYVTVGMLFRPMADNPYLSVKSEDGEDEGITSGIAMSARK